MFSRPGRPSGDSADHRDQGIAGQASHHEIREVDIHHRGDTSGRSDIYLALHSPHRTERKVRGSRFIAEAFPVGSVEEAMTRLATARMQESSANHHCWAYRIGPEGEQYRFNDDGEPSGTAGPPILQQIAGRNVVDIIVIITRYFGGTLLGTGGLIRAYGDAAALVLDEADIREKVVRTAFSLRFGYDDTSLAMQTMARFDVVVLASDYGADTQLRVGVRRSQADAFVTAFTDNLAGRGLVSRAAV